MDHDEYTSLVDRGHYPSSSLVPLAEPFVDERGSIQNLLLKQCHSVALITSRQGSVRANHRHQTDWHYIYVLSGSVLYFERAAGDTELPEPLRLNAHDMVFTAPNREHSLLFTTDCTF